MWKNKFLKGAISDNSNAMPKATFNFATENNLQTAKFPLKEYIKDIRRTVLNINHTFEMLMRRYIGEEWKDIMDDVVPTRKSFRKAEKNNSNQNKENNDNKEKQEVEDDEEENSDNENEEEEEEKETSSKKQKNEIKEEENWRKKKNLVILQ